MKQTHIRILVSSAAALLLPCDECGAPSEARCMRSNGRNGEVAHVEEIVHTSRRAKVRITNPHEYVNWKINRIAENNMIIKLGERDSVSV